MSLPEPMPCLLDACPSPLSCSDYGGCREAAKDSARCYEVGLAECRKRGVIPKAWMREVQE